MVIKMRDLEHGGPGFLYTTLKSLLGSLPLHTERFSECRYSPVLSMVALPKYRLQFTAEDSLRGGLAGNCQRTAGASCEMDGLVVTLKIAAPSRGCSLSGVRMGIPIWLDGAIKFLKL
jgi:hypothetical protein